MTDSDYCIPPSPDLAGPYCPGCEPERALVTEILETRYCPTHPLTTAGADDAALAPADRPVSNAEADGHDCRAMAKLLARPVRARRGQVDRAERADEEKAL